MRDFIRRLIRRVLQAFLILTGTWCLGTAIVNFYVDQSHWGEPAVFVLIGVAAICGAFWFKD